jgi:hypothetical protein
MLLDVAVAADMCLLGRGPKTVMCCGFLIGAVSSIVLPLVHYESHVKTVGIELGAPWRVDSFQPATTARVPTFLCIHVYL